MNEHRGHDMARLTNREREISRWFCVTCGIDTGPANLCRARTKRGSVCFQVVSPEQGQNVCRWHEQKKVTA